MAHFRHPKLQEERLVLHGEYVIVDPQAMAGQWRNLMPNCEGLCVDVGCGKGLWTTAAARAWNDALFIGVDHERMCISFAAEQAAVGGVASSGWAKTADEGYVAPSNLRFVEAAAADLPSLFAPGEIDHLFLNYPTPFPKKKETSRRIVTASHLASYAPLLASSGVLHLKTDSQPLFDYAIDQLELVGFEVTALTRDLYGEAATAEEFDAVDQLQSAYERKTLMRGAKIHALQACVSSRISGAFDSSCVESKSLYDYLPDDLDEITYVPLGMENALTNMRNRRHNGHGGIWGQQ